MRNWIRNFLVERNNKRLAKNAPQMMYSLNWNNQNRKGIRVSSSTAISYPQNLDLLAHVFIGHHNFLEASNGITIGEGTQVTNFISILTHSSHVSIRLYGEEYAKHNDPIGYKKGSVVIGAYCFIGPHSTIQADSKIGKGSLIHAYSNVKGEFPDFSIIAGNPAERIGDTRDQDKRYLEDNPELIKLYEKWAKS